MQGTEGGKGSRESPWSFISVQETPAVCQRASVIHSLLLIYRISCVFSHTSRVTVCSYMGLKRQVDNKHLKMFLTVSPLLTCVDSFQISQSKGICLYWQRVSWVLHDCTGLELCVCGDSVWRFCWVILWLLLQVTRTATNLHRLSIGKHTHRTAVV